MNEKGVKTTMLGKNQNKGYYITDSSTFYRPTLITYHFVSRCVLHNRTSVFLDPTLYPSV